MCRMFKGFYSEIEAGFVSDGIVVGVEFFNKTRIVPRVDNNGHVTVVLCGGTDHGGSANIDILNRILETAVRASNGGLKGIQVDYDHVDRGNVMAGHHAIVGTATT